MAKKHILHHEYRHGFKAIGITSAQKDYRLCWLLNNALGYDLKRMADFCPENDPKNESPGFAVYRFENPSMFLYVYLVANKNLERQLFTRLRNFDYLLLFKQPSEQTDLNEVVKAVRKITQVQAASLLPDLHDKKANALFFDFEMFLSRP